jgi:ATP-dependent DNA ligase
MPPASRQPLRLAPGTSRVHWVRPEAVEVEFLAWTEDYRLRQVVYEGLREDQPTGEVRREMPHPVTGTGDKSVRRRTLVEVHRLFHQSQG